MLDRNLYSLIIQSIDNSLLRGCSDRERFVITWDYQRGDVEKQLNGTCSQMSGENPGVQRVQRDQFSLTGLHLPQPAPGKLSRVRVMRLRPSKGLLGCMNEAVGESITKSCTQMVLLSHWCEDTMLLHLLKHHFEESKVWWKEMELSKTKNFFEGMGGTSKESVYHKELRH